MTVQSLALIVSKGSFIPEVCNQTMNGSAVSAACVHTVC